jgi:hypothetical protein
MNTIKTADRAAFDELQGESWGSSGWGQGTLDRCSSELAALEQELNSLGTGADAMGKSMALSLKMQNIQQVVSAITKIREMNHECIMGTLR